MSEQIISTYQLSKKYKHTYSVKNLELNVHRGEIYGFLGPNGAGKTTTIRMLLGLIRPTKGSVRIFDKELNKNRMAVLKQIGSLVESPSYYGKLTAVENLEIVRRILNVDKKNIDDVLRIVRLDKVKDRLVKEYSLGMKQRLGIAMALLGHPQLLILDEPTNGLDPSGIQEMRELIKQLAREREMTILVSSHMLSEVDQMATEVGIIHKGELIFQDRMEVLRQKSNESVKMRVSNPEKTAKILSDHEVVTDFSNQDHTVTLAKVEDSFIGYVNDLLVRNHVQVYRIEENKKSLETIFLELTQRGDSL
ncbi:ABC transporter ATP-binding protein [Halalkalibacterium halodurans]|uniref:ABC transporter ATP-binding protein n=1 Tax=Halalkalibacterium halodurans TaxID=86665 RepID=UPI002E208581|nr:ABC transporter ATP-binding protein [Halalkalibacterium halodurans]